MFWPTILSHRINEESPLWEVRIITILSRFLWILSLNNTTILFSGLPYYPLASAIIWKSCRSTKLKERNCGSRWSVRLKKTNSCCRLESWNRIPDWHWHQPFNQFKQRNWQIHIYDKYIYQFGQIHFQIWTHSIGNLDKCIWHFE